jgi:hypothetical protein
MTYEYPCRGRQASRAPNTGSVSLRYAGVKRNLEFQLDLMNASNVVLTTNIELRRDGRPYANQRISDTGVAVYFTRKGCEQAIACDKWDSVRDNLHAVAKTIEALRGSDRWDRGDGRCSIPGFHDHPGISERRHSGPAKATWYEVLGVSADAPCEVIDAAGKAMRRKTHPDAGGSAEDLSGGAGRHRRVEPMTIRPYRILRSCCR